MLALAVLLKAHAQYLCDNWVEMSKCMANTVFPHWYTPELVHAIRSVFPRCGLTRQIWRKTSTKVNDLRLVQAAESPQHRGTDNLIINAFYSRTYNQKGETMGNLHVLRNKEVTLAYTWRNLNFTHQSGLLLGLSDITVHRLWPLWISDLLLYGWEPEFFWAMSDVTSHSQSNVCW